MRCLLLLARCRPTQWLTTSEIAAAEGLSSPYAAKLLAVLRQAGFIESERGRVGGYRMAGNPLDISVGDVLEVLGEPLFDEQSFCRQHAGTETNGSCVHHGGCTLRVLWGTLESWMRHVLDRITLVDLMQNEGQMGELVRQRLADATIERAVQLVPLTIATKD